MTKKFQLHTIEATLKIFAL